MQELTPHIVAILEGFSTISRGVEQRNLNRADFSRASRKVRNAADELPRRPADHLDPAENQSLQSLRTNTHDVIDHFVDAIKTQMSDNKQTRAKASSKFDHAQTACYLAVLPECRFLLGLIDYEHALLKKHAPAKADAIDEDVEQDRRESEAARRARERFEEANKRRR